MKFKIFRMTVIIEREPPIIIKSVEPEEVIVVYSDRFPNVTVLAPNMAQRVWDRIMDQARLRSYFKGEKVTNRVPLIKEFRDEYQKERGLVPTLRASKDYVDNRTVKVEGDADGVSYYVLHRDRVVR